MENNDFQIIYTKYVHQVFCFLLKLSGNYHIAEELTQETFIKAYIAIDEFRGECQLKVWLCQIGKNLYFDYIKKAPCTISFETLDSDVFYIEQNNLENDVLSKENIKNFNKYILKLKEPYRTIFINRVFEELSYSEIGAQFQKTENWVRVNFYRAKHTLHSIIMSNERTVEK